MGDPIPNSLLPMDSSARVPVQIGTIITSPWPQDARSRTQKVTVLGLEWTIVLHVRTQGVLMPLQLQGMKGQAIRLGISNGRRRQKKKKNKGNTNSNNLFPLRLALFCFPGTISFLQIKFHNPYRFVTLPFLTSFKISLFLFLAFPSLLLFTISCSLCSLVSSSATSVSTIS